MTKIGTWLASLTPTLVARVLASLGMGVVTITGITAAWDTLRDTLIAHVHGIPLDIAQLAGMAGVWDGLALILGAVAARVTLAALSSSKRILGLS